MNWSPKDLFKNRATVIVPVIILLLSLSSISYAQDKPVEKKVLANGMTVLFQEGAGEPASACLFVKTGPAYEASENRGITRLLNNVLLSIDPLGNSKPASRRVEQSGGLLSAETSVEYSCFKLAVASKNLPAALKALGDVFKAGNITEASVSREKEAVMSYRMRAEDRIEENVVRAYLKKTLDDSSYLFINEGDSGNISRLNAKQLNEWYMANYQPANMVLSVCGKMNSAAVFKLAEASFNGSGPARQVSGHLTSIPPATEGVFKIDSSPGFSAVLLGYEAPPAGSADYPVVVVAQSILACGMGSSMFRKLRDEDVLAYGFGSWMPLTSGASRLAIYAVADEGMDTAAGTRLKACIEELKSGTVDNDDLGRAKSVVLGRVSAYKESNSGKAGKAGMNEVMGLGQEYDAGFEREVGKLDKKELARVSGRYFGRCSEVVLKPRSDSLY